MQWGPHFVLRGLGLCFVMLLTMPAGTQQRDPQVRTNIQRDLADGRPPDRDMLNSNTVTIVTAPVGGAFAAMGSHMAHVLDDGDNLRVLPIIGEAQQCCLYTRATQASPRDSIVQTVTPASGCAQFKASRIAHRSSYRAHLSKSDLASSASGRWWHSMNCPRSCIRPRLASDRRPLA
jgi:hypothetical protein